MTGESLADATERFEEGVGAIEACRDIFARQVDISHPDVDDVRRYESPERHSDKYASLMSARNGGVDAGSVRLHNNDADPASPSPGSGPRPRLGTEHLQPEPPTRWATTRSVPMCHGSCLVSDIRRRRDAPRG